MGNEESKDSDYDDGNHVEIHTGVILQQEDAD